MHLHRVGQLAELPQHDHATCHPDPDLQQRRAGNRARFSQVPRGQEVLLSTGGRELRGASPFDRVWGIVFKEEDALASRAAWGECLLGKALVRVRGG
jgi:predicted NAD-dependent protein-ADP-ribosyltransferase YbiA (DUF1768 family)